MTEAQRESLCALIRQAGAHAQALRDAGLQVDKKARQDFVSQADLAVEQEIKGWLQAHFPEEGFLGEESGFEGDDQTVWVLDPVDGPGVVAGHRHAARRRSGVSPFWRGRPDAGACRRRSAPRLL